MALTSILWDEDVTYYGEFIMVFVRKYRSTRSGNEVLHSKMMSRWRQNIHPPLLALDYREET
jgi:hypothetical protein